MPLSGRRSPALGEKPAVWRWCVRARKARPAFPARAVICGMKRATRRAGASANVRAVQRRNPPLPPCQTFLFNDEGQPLYTLPADERLPVFSPHYSRSSVMTFMLSELLAQALMQINSAAQRMKMIHSGAPRQLRNIILTLPSAMPKPEREIFRRRMIEAIGVVWKAMGWHPSDASFTTAAQQASSLLPVPEVQMEWDEATCGQMVYLYNESQVNFAGKTEAFFASMARPDKELAEGERAGKTLRIASIDIGGGTTDLAITQYWLDDGVGNNVKILPRLLFREGFKVAGDDILLDVIQLYV